MTFDEIPLYEAVHDSYRLLEQPRSDVWLREEERRESLYRTILMGLPRVDVPRFTFEQVLEAWGLYGKSQTVNERQQKKLELVILTARAHGRRCFYAARGLGECTAEVTLDRLRPGSRGGLYVLENCVLACSFHNQSRGDRAMEDYLGQPEEVIA